MRTSRGRRAPWIRLLALGSFFAVASAHAGGVVAFGPHDARSVFLIAKSQNRNQVHFGVHLDAACDPVGSAPVFGYWRMVEAGGAIEPILAIEEAAYGLSDAQVVEKGIDGSTVRVVLRAVPERPVVISVKQVDGRCTAVARGTIAGAEARLELVYVKVRWPFGVDYLLLRGRGAEEQSVHEIIRY